MGPGCQGPCEGLGARAGARHWPAGVAAHSDLHPKSPALAFGSALSRQSRLALAGSGPLGGTARHVGSQAPFVLSLSVSGVEGHRQVRVLSLQVAPGLYLRRALLALPTGQSADSTPCSPPLTLHLILCVFYFIY